MSDTTIKGITFTRINNDSNGNPRYVCHFLKLITRAEMDEFWKTSKNAISDAYAFAVKRSNKIHGRKFHNKQYGGGIVFQSYSLQELADCIIALKPVENIEYEGWTNSATWCEALYLSNERYTDETISAIRKSGEKVTIEQLKAISAKLHIRIDDWCEGEINWQEIANSYNEAEY